MNENESRRVVDLCCIRDKRVLLVCKRGIWILPGGKPHDGETDAMCLIREVKEEIGMKCAVNGLIKNFIGTSPFSQTRIVVTVYSGEVSGISAPQNEISDLAWFSFDQIPKTASAVTDQIVNDLHSEGLL